MDKPAWFDELLGIQNQLCWFLDNKSNTRPLKDSNPVWMGDEDREYIWSCMQTLEDQGIWQLKELGKKRFEAWDNIQIRFNPESEALVREWLNKPKVRERLQHWQACLEPSEFSVNTELMKKVIEVPGKTDQDVVMVLEQVKSYLQQGLTLTQISARCFWGDSKFLSKSRFKQWYSSDESHVLNRPLLIDVHLADNAKGILFVENQDSYLAIQQGALVAAKELHCVYSKGFQGSAGRSRQDGMVKFHYSRETPPERIATFEEAWFTRLPDTWSTFFWGDLDYSGMRILAALRGQFTELSAWQSGYQPLLDVLKAGGGHLPEQADKSKQKPCAVTGCRYTDENLIPALIKYGKFIDQEFVC